MEVSRIFYSSGDERPDRVCEWGVKADGRAKVTLRGPFYRCLHPIAYRLECCIAITRQLGGKEEQ